MGRLDLFQVSLVLNLSTNHLKNVITIRTAPKDGILLPAGPAYLAYARRTLLNRTLAEDIEIEEKAAADAALAAKANGSSNDSLGFDADLGEEDEDIDLLMRDPKEWKSQDHYAVLGLQKYRYKATDEQIKIAREYPQLRFTVNMALMRC